MSNTYRKDRNGISYKEGLKKKDGRYRCQCHYCIGVDKNELVEKIAEKELKTELKEIIEEGIDHDCTIQDKILKQILNR